MSQTSSLSIPNSAGSTFRANNNTNLAALFSSNSGAAAPSPTVGGMLWLDTGVSPVVLRVRNNANTAWLVVNPETLAANTVRGNSTGSAAAETSIDMATLRTMLGFGPTLGTNGAIPIPGGGLIQYGTATTSAGGSVTVTLPTTYTAFCRPIVTVASGGALYVAHVDTVTLSNFGIRSWISNTGTLGAASCIWATIGY